MKPANPFRWLVIFGLWLSLISSIGGITSKLAATRGPERAKIRELADQAGAIDKRLAEVERTKGPQPEARAELAKLEAGLADLRTRLASERAFLWWKDAIAPMVTLLLLILFLRRKDLLAPDPAGDGAR